MKICHSEVIKKIKELEEKKSTLLAQERSRRVYSYVDASAKIIPNYNYKKTHARVDELDINIRRLRHLLAVANVSVIIEEFNVTLGEALVMLAQMQSKCSVLEGLAGAQQITQRVTYNGKMEILECNYDVEKALADYESLRNEIGRLQVAIDRANLNNYIEIE